MRVQGALPGEGAAIVAPKSADYCVAGAFRDIGLIVIAALVSALIPSVHEIKDGLHWPHPAFAVAAAMLAAYCVLEVGRGPPLSFIYFRF